MYEEHLSGINNEVTSLKRRHVELISLVHDVVWNFLARFSWLSKLGEKHTISLYDLEVRINAGIVDVYLHNNNFLQISLGDMKQVLDTESWFIGIWIVEFLLFVKKLPFKLGFGKIFSRTPQLYITVEPRLSGPLFTKSLDYPNLIYVPNF